MTTENDCAGGHGRFAVKFTAPAGRTAYCPGGTVGRKGIGARGRGDIYAEGEVWPIRLASLKVPQY